MITVSELIVRLSEYAAKSPENGMAEIMLGSTNELVWEFGEGRDGKGLMGGHILILVPNLNGNRIAVRELRLQ